MDHPDQEKVVDPPSRGRGGLQSAIRAALTREGPQGPAHWAGERVAAHRQEPIDVAGTGRPGRLPPTA